MQSQIGIWPGEGIDDGARRLESLLDQAYPARQSRTTWRRQLRLVDQAGVVDLPGTTWRDRPTIDRGDDLHVISDKSRAPGLLGEVSFHSAVEAAQHLAQWVGPTTTRS